MCMLTLISEKGKLIMLIKQALAYGNKRVFFVKVTDQVAMQLVYQMFRSVGYLNLPVGSNQSSLNAGVFAFTQHKLILFKERPLG